MDHRRHERGDRRRRGRNVRHTRAYFPELFSARFRYTGVAVSKEFAAGASGGVAPFITAALIGWSGGAYWPMATYIVVLAGVTFFATFFAPQTRGCDLSE